jgi:hypothetical protein
MEMLDLLETVRAEESNIQKIFADEGASVSASQKQNAKRLDYQRKLVEATRLVADVYTGKRPLHYLKEAFGTSDFPFLFGDIIDRQLLANYQETPQVWPLYAKRATVSDFRTVNRFAVNGAEAHLVVVPQQTEYPQPVSLADARYQYAALKYGRRIAFSWEAMTNDDLDALKDIPARFGKAARRTEELFATNLHVDANGPIAGFYAAGHNNLIPAAMVPGQLANPSLSVQALQAAFAMLAQQVDADGEPITIEAVTLEVCPALEVTAQNILHATEIRMMQSITPAAQPGAQWQELVAENWMKTRVRLAVNPYIPIVATAGTVGRTTWFLHADPSVGRPAMEMGFLRGHEQPEIFIKQPNQARVGGGIDPMNGDFNTDSIEYKVRHVIGGVLEDWKMSVGSNGANA